SNRIYTPQVVVNGRSECVGSEEREVMRRIQDALAAAPAAEVSVGLAPAEAAPRSSPSPAPNPGSGGPGPGAGGGSALRIAVTARLLRPVSGGAAPELWVALAESGLTTAVRAGENARATLHDDQVVRQLVKAATLSGVTAGASAAATSAEVE